MQIIYGLKKIRKFRKPVVVLGVFDGVHLAHQRILQEAVKKAKAVKGRAILVTFWPHPQKEESLYSLEHRLRLISGLGIDVAIVIQFNRSLSRMPAEDFIKNVLVRKIHPEYIYIGKNFTFGKNARGNYQLLKKFSGAYNFKLKIFAVIKINHQPVSSTYIRNLIRRGRLAAAEELLGRPVSILGTIIKGASLARKLGFPTANIDPHHEVMPPSGVYVVETVLSNKKFYGVCSIGVKPTFQEHNTPACRQAGQYAIRNTRTQHIEVHLFNFKKDIYGKYLEVYFIKKIRNQKKFSSHTALTKEIKKDIIYTKRVLSLPLKHHNI